jgi:hypothetical protein
MRTLDLATELDCLTKNQKNLIFAIGILGYLTTDQGGLIVARHVKFASRDKTARRILNDLVSQKILLKTQTKFRGLTAYVLAPIGVPLAEALVPGCHFSPGVKPILRGDGFRHRQVSQAYIVDRMGEAMANQQRNPNSTQPIFLTEYLRFATSACHRIKPRNPNQKIRMTTGIHFNRLQSSSTGRWPDGMILTEAWEDDWPDADKICYRFEWVEGERCDKKRVEYANAIAASWHLERSEIKPYLGGYAGATTTAISSISCTFVVADWAAKTILPRIVNAAQDLLEKEGPKIERYLNNLRVEIVPVGETTFTLQDRPSRTFDYSCYHEQFQERTA